MSGTDQQEPVRDGNSRRDLVRIRILCVDDDRDFLQLIKTRVEERNKNIDVDVTFSVEEVPKLLKAGKHDVIISDYQMPGMNGLELLRALREDNKKVPFILLTGKGGRDIMLQVLDEGAYYLCKKASLSLFDDIEMLIAVIAEERKQDSKMKVDVVSW